MRGTRSDGSCPHIPFQRYLVALVVAIAQGVGPVVIALSYSSVRNHRDETPRESRAFTGRVVLLSIIFWELYVSSSLDPEFSCTGVGL